MDNLQTLSDLSRLPLSIEQIRAERRRRHTSTLVEAETIRRHIPKAFWPLVDVRARYKGFYGGRGSAKTHSLATALVAEAAKRQLRVLCCREYQRSLERLITSGNLRR